MSETAQFPTRYQIDDTADFAVNGGIGLPHILRDEMRSFNEKLRFVIDPDLVGTGRYETTDEIDLDKIRNTPGTVQWNAWVKGDVSVHTEDSTDTDYNAWRVIATSGKVASKVRGVF